MMDSSRMNKFQFIELKIEYMIKARKPRHSTMSAWVSCITGEASDKGQVSFFVVKMPMYIPGKEVLEA